MLCTWESCGLFVRNDWDDDDDDPSTFEAELAILDEIEAENAPDRLGKYTSQQIA